MVPTCLRPEIVEVDTRAVQPRGEQVIHRELDAGRVELLEDCANPADGFAVGLVDPWEFDVRYIKVLKFSNGGRPTVAPLLPGLRNLVCRIASQPILQSVSPCAEASRCQQAGARMRKLL